MASRRSYSSRRVAASAALASEWLAGKRHQGRSVMTAIPPDRRAFVGAALTLPLADAAAGDKTKRIRVGVIGCGSVSGVYLPHLTKCPFVEVVSTCDIIPERAERRAREFKIANHYPHIDKMLAGEPFDLLVNTTDMQEHEHLNRQAIDAGKHV